MSRADRSIRRLAAVPQPYEEESFGSWLARLAAAHHVQRDDFLRALQSESRATGGSPADPERATPALLAELCHRTGWERSRLERLVLGPEQRVPGPNVRALESYCPTCWAQDRKRGTQHVRRRWRERWGVMCDVHEIPLRESPLSAEELLCGAALEGPKFCDERPEGCFPPPLSVEVTRAQTQIRALESPQALPNEGAARAQVLRDLALLAGTRFSGESLIEWSLWGQGVASRQLYWQDGRDPAVTELAAEQPRGTLEVRRHALRIATLLVLHMEGQWLSRRAGDMSLVAMLSVVGAQTPLAWACNDLRRRWSQGYRERWSATFAWPDRRDPVCRAQIEAAPQGSDVSTAPAARRARTRRAMPESLAASSRV